MAPPDSLLTDAQGASAALAPVGGREDGPARPAGTGTTTLPREQLGMQTGALVRAARTWATGQADDLAFSQAAIGAIRAAFDLGYHYGCDLSDLRDDMVAHLRAERAREEERLGLRAKG